jgi:hypothetical protein
MKKIILILILSLTFFNCGTKLKNSEENELKEKLNKETELIQKQKFQDSLRLVVEEEVKRKYSENNSEDKKTENTKTTTVEITEVLKNPTEGFRPVPNTDLFINDKNGQLLERKTKMIIEERFKEQVLKSKQIEIEENEKKRKDSLVMITVINDIVEKHIIKYDKKAKQIKENKKKESSISIWVWITIIIIILLIVAFIIFRKAILTYFPFLRIFS